MCYRDDVSKTFDVRCTCAVKTRAHALRSALSQQFGGQRSGDRAAQPQGLAVQELDRLPRRRVRPLYPGGEIAHHGLIDRQLAVSAEFHNQRAEQLVVRR